MRANLDLAFGATGALVYFDAHARPTGTPTIAIRAWDAAESVTAETALGAVATETNPNTTLDGAAGVGQSNPRLIPLTATTGIVVGRQYLLTAADGYSEWVEVTEVDSGVSVTVKHPLHNTYASGDAFVSTRFAATIDATWIADEDNISDGTPIPGWRARVTYVVGGLTYVRSIDIDVVREVGSHSVTGPDVDLVQPGWMNRLPTDHRPDQGRKLIDSAYSEVRLDCLTIWRAADLIANAEVVDKLVIYKAIEMAELGRFMSGGQSDSIGVKERLDVATARYKERFKSLVRVLSAVPVRTSSGAAEVHHSPGVMRG